LPVACCLLPVACCLLPVACCLLPVACCLLPVAWCLLPVACCLLPVACCLLPVACCGESALMVGIVKSIKVCYFIRTKMSRDFFCGAKKLCLGGYSYKRHDKGHCHGKNSGLPALFAVWLDIEGPKGRPRG
jgi:hypothetical protein